MFFYRIMLCFQKYPPMTQAVYYCTEDYSDGLIEDFDGEVRTMTIEENPVVTIEDVAPSPTLMQNLKAKDGKFMGYFCIPSVNIYVPSYECGSEVDLGTAQWYTDRENSAAMLVDWVPDQHFITIADHVNQSFSRLNKVKPGTTATFEWYDNMYTNLVCIDAGVGINDWFLYDQYGTNWLYWNCDFIAYTCISGTANSVYITKWNYS